MDNQKFKEIMTLQTFDATDGFGHRGVTAEQVAEMIRTGRTVVVSKAKEKKKREEEKEAREEKEVREAKEAREEKAPAAMDYSADVEKLRSELALVRGVGVGHDALTDPIPKLLPLAHVGMDANGYVYYSGAGVVCLDVQNVFSDDEREAVRRGVRTLPMTLMAFVGSSGMSMKVLVRVAPARGEQVATVTAMRDFTRLAHRQMRTLYSNVIPQHISVLHELHLTDGLTMSVDPQLLYLPDAQAAVVDDEVEVKMPRRKTADGVEQELMLAVPADLSHRSYYDRLFDRLFDDVRQEFLTQGREADLETEAFMQTVVERAAQLKVSEAEMRARMVRLFEFEDAHDIRKYVSGIYSRLHPLRATGNAVTDNMLALESHLFGGYEFERSTINGALYMREKTSFGEWRRLENEDVNSFVVELQEAGVKANRSLVESVLGSNRISSIDPIAQLVKRVRGRWDGRDHIEALAQRVPTSCRQWPRWFHVWFLAMVRQWLRPDKDYANQVVPILVGPQGVGKSTFCRRLLPPELMDGYLESGDFRAEKEMLRAMATFQLINIDEFNRYSQAEQEGIMKNFIQRADVRLKKPYRQEFEVLQRRASFIATCNPEEVLADETGSRRYICVKVTGNIRLLDDIDYVQLYAQAVAELEIAEREGVHMDSVVGRTYFSKAEEAAIERNNRRFVRASVAVARFRQMFELLPSQRGRRPKTERFYTREQLFQLVQQEERKALSDSERKSLYQYLQNEENNAPRGQKYKNSRGLYRVKLIK